MGHKKDNFLCDFLKQGRLAVSLNQGQVAKLLGYTNPQFISNWERGLSSPPVKILPKLAKIYGISADELFEAVIEETLAAKRAEFEQGKKLA